MSKLNDESIDFSSLFPDAKLVKHNQYVLSKTEREQKRKKQSTVKRAKTLSGTHKPAGVTASSLDYIQNQASVALSDSFEAHWPENKPIRYFRENEVNNTAQMAAQSLSYSAKDMLKKLSMGHFLPEIEIDLHGLTGTQAKAELLAVIFEATKRHYPCINIIHGHGNGTLKRKVPNWLIQHPDVAGFIQAPRQYGGKAGLLVLIGIDFQTFKP